MNSPCAFSSIATSSIAPGQDTDEPVIKRIPMLAAPPRTGAHAAQAGDHWYKLLTARRCT